MDESGAEVTFDPNAAVAGDADATVIDGINSLNAVACISTSACVATDSVGQEITFDPSSPDGATEASIDNSSYALGAVACPGAHQCTAGDDHGRLITFDPSAPAAASKPATAPEQPKKPKLICESETRTDSSIPKRVCRTPEQIEAERQAGRVQTDAVQDRLRYCQGTAC